MGTFLEQPGNGESMGVIPGRKLHCLWDSAADAATQAYPSLVFTGVIPGFSTLHLEMM